jgi:predicted transcriptional regulator
MTNVPLQVHIGGTLKEMGDRFIKAWKRVEAGESSPERHLSFENYATFAKTVTPRRHDLLKALRKSGPMSVRALSMLLKRDYKSVHGDVAKLLDVGLIDRTDSGLVEVTWDKVSAELDLLAA